MGGNHVYGTHIFTPSYHTISVEQNIPFVRNGLGNKSYDEELTVCFVKEPTEIAEESVLSCHLNRRLGNTNAAFVIINSLAVTFVTDNSDDIVLMDSQLHFPKGALLAKCRRDIGELFKWLKAKLSTTVNNQFMHSYACSFSLKNLMVHFSA